MKILEKISKEELVDFLVTVGISIKSIRVMFSRRQLSKKAALAVISADRFRNRKLTPNDFYGVGSQFMKNLPASQISKDPSKFFEPSEDNICRSICEWWDYQMPWNERFGLIHIENEGNTGKIYGARSKSMGKRAGVADYLIQKDGVPYGWVEVKSMSGKLSHEQKAFQAYIHPERYALVRSLDEFIQVIKQWGISPKTT